MGEVLCHVRTSLVWKTGRLYGLEFVSWVSYNHPLSFQANTS